jgi:hypothetical protein
VDPRLVPEAGGEPTDADAAQIARAWMHEPVRSVWRFPTGLAHWVYDVVAESGREIGHSFNREEPVPLEPERLQRLSELLEAALSGLQ